MKITTVTVTKSLHQDHGLCCLQLLFFSYTCTLLFCWKIKKAVLITVFPSKLEYKPLFTDIYKKVAMITFSTVFTFQIYIF